MFKINILFLKKRITHSNIKTKSTINGLIRKQFSVDVSDGRGELTLRLWSEAAAGLPEISFKKKMTVFFSRIIRSLFSNGVHYIK